MSELAEQLPSRQRFSTVVNSIFNANTGNGESFDVCLVNVDEIVSNDYQDNFTLLFRAPVDAGVQQGMYNLRHEELGQLDLFMVPVKKDDSGFFLEAVFNLIKTISA